MKARSTLSPDKARSLEGMPTAMTLKIQAVGLGNAVVRPQLDKVAVVEVDIFFKLAVKLVEAEISLREQSLPHEFE